MYLHTIPLSHTNRSVNVHIFNERLKNVRPFQGPGFGRSAVESNSEDEDEDEEILGPTHFSGAELRSARPPHSEDEGRNSVEVGYYS